MQPIIYAIIIGVVLFCILLLLVLTTSMPNKKSLLKQKLSNDKKQNFSDIYAKLIKTQPTELAKKIGVDLAGYTRWCLITDTEPNYEKIILTRVIALFLLIIGSIIGALTLNIVVMILFIVITIILMIVPTYKVKKEAEYKLLTIRSELPRFLDMLSTALKIGVPIQNALKITAYNCEGVLGKEVMESIAVADINSTDWRIPLQNLAQKYNDDDFADFVMAIVIAYEKGNDITLTVTNKAEQLRKNTILRCKNSSSKLSTLILLPLLAFKVLPIIVILMLPLVVQIIQNF